MSTSTGVIDWASAQDVSHASIFSPWYIIGTCFDIGSKISRTAYQMLLINALIQM